MNLGPFIVDTQESPASARQILTELEQVRWVLSGLLENPALSPVFPVRIFVTSRTAARDDLAQPTLHGCYLGAVSPGNHANRGAIAMLLLRDNTPPLPPDVESGLKALFDTLQTTGSHVRWGGMPPPSEATLAFARMQLFATKFDYSTSFHIFLSSLRSGSSIRAAASNAFGKSWSSLEEEAQQRFAAGRWEEVSVQGRPLDPKRDLGEHAVSPALVEALLADTQIASNPDSAEAAYKAAINAGTNAEKAAGFEGLAALSIAHQSDPTEYTSAAIAAGSRSAPLYLLHAQHQTGTQALETVRRAGQLNTRWAEPVWREAEATSNQDREALLKRATQLDLRNGRNWTALALAAAANNHASVAQAAWLRAEECAHDDAERSRIHQARLDSEASRLDAADAARQRGTDAVEQADRQAQRAQAARIRAAEAAANRTAPADAGAAGTASGAQEAVPWQQMAGAKLIEGFATKVDCSHEPSYLTVAPPRGAPVTLVWDRPADSPLGCGALHPAPRVSITYKPEASHTRGVVGIVTSVENTQRP